MTLSITDTGGGTLEPLLAREGGRGVEEKPDAVAKETRADIFKIFSPISFQPGLIVPFHPLSCTDGEFALY